MPRQPREKSDSGMYHVMLRGINQQNIFEDEEDHIRFIETIKKYKAICGYKIFAFCIMGNHLHLLLKTGAEELSLIIKRIASSYVFWYNRKYRRKGHLFQERYKSVAIDDDGYFLSVLRYIHQNPVRSGLTENIGAYSFSSYSEYQKEMANIVDIDFVFSIIGKEEFESFHKELDNNEYMSMEKQEFRMSDLEAKAVIQQVSKCKSTTEFQELEKNQMITYIKKLKGKGLSIRQISRLTGISKGIVQRN